jgi:hypothetical protein
MSMNTLGERPYVVPVDHEGGFYFARVGIAGDGSLDSVGLTRDQRAQAAELLAATLQSAADALRRTARRR